MFAPSLNSLSAMMREFNKIKTYTVGILLATGKYSYVIDQNSPLNGAHIVSVRARRYSSTARALTGDTLANDANFDAAFLTLKKDTTTIVLQVPLKHIEQASLQTPDKGYPVYAANLNFNSCTIEIATGTTIDNAKMIELTFEYFEPKK